MEARIKTGMERGMVMDLETNPEEREATVEIIKVLEDQWTASVV
jgi:hypothetical protein